MKSILGITRKPDVTFYKNGRIDISSRVVKCLKIGKGDVIDIATHEGEFYLFIKHKAKDLRGTHEAHCYRSSKYGFNFRAYSKKLCLAMLRECQTEKAKIPVGEAIDLPEIGIAVPLITRLNIQQTA